VSLPKVSIAIPVYNREKLVQRAIESALTQTYPEIEVVVVDNCSTDNTYEVIQKYAQTDKRVKCFRNELNLGPVPNWRRSVELSQGEYVKILFSDDWMEPQAIERSVRPFQEYGEEIGFTYSTGKIHFEDSRDPLVSFDNFPSGLLDSLDFLWDNITWLNTPLTPCVALFRRSDLLEFLTLNIPTRLSSHCNQHGIGNDTLLYWRSCEKYPKFYRISDQLMNLNFGINVEHPSITASLMTSGKQDILSQCYELAFCYFLAKSNLSEKNKRILNAGIFIKRVSFRPIKSQVSAFNKLFPSDYQWWKFNLLDRRILIYLKYRVVASLKRHILNREIAIK
jgi:glycosyltransferase involved in cell wall biosynthesis